MKIKAFFTQLFPAAVCALLSLVVISCSNLFETKSFDDSNTSGTAYICVKSAGTTNSNRTIFPTADANKLTNLVLKGTKQGDSEIELASADTLEALSSQRIEIEAGNWDFTLTATLNGVAFSGTATAKPKAGKTINLRFQLTPDSSIDKGGFSITVFFEGDVHSIFAEVYDQEQTYPIFTDSNITIETNSQNKKYIVFEKPISSGFDAGSYKVQIYLQDDNHNSLNCYETSVQIVAGYISEAVAYVNISSQYSLTLNFNGGGWSGSGVSTSPEVYYFLTKQDADLPVSSWLSKTGYFFAGWYDNAELTGEPITTIPAGTKGNITLWAKWVEGFDPEPYEGEAVHLTLPDYKIYVANSSSGGGSGNTGERGSPLDSIENAVAKIHELVQDTENSYVSGQQWAIVLLSDLEGAQTVTTDADNDFPNATENSIAGLIICSENAESIKTLNGGFTEANLGTTLTLLSRKKIALQDVKITGGYNDYGGGILAQCQYLLLNSGVQVYGNTATEAGGGICIKPSSGMTSVTIQGAIIGGESGEGNVCNNPNNGLGGGVYLGGDGNPYLTLKSGAIKGNKADSGAGVAIEKRDFTMEGGSIAYNSEYSASNSCGGGVAIYGSGRFFMKDGSISSNSSAWGAGVYVSYAIFDMSGGLITGNTVARNAGCGAGVYLFTDDSSGKFYMSGISKITEDNRITLFGVKDYITLNGTLMATSPVATFEFDIEKEDPEPSYVEGRKLVVDGSKPSLSSADFEATCARFAVAPDSTTGKKWMVKVLSNIINYGDFTVTEYYGGLTEKVISADGHLNVSLQKPDPVMSDSLLKFTASTLEGNPIPASDMSLIVYYGGYEVPESYVPDEETVYNYIKTSSGNELRVKLENNFNPECEYNFKLLIAYDGDIYEKIFNVTIDPVIIDVTIDVTDMDDNAVNNAINTAMPMAAYARSISLKFTGENETVNNCLYSSVANSITTITENKTLQTKIDLDFSGVSGSKLSAISESAFENSDLYKTIVLSSSTTAIGNKAFSGSSLTSLNLNNVTSIGTQAFKSARIGDEEYDDDLGEYVITASLNLSNATNISNDAFDSANIVFEVPNSNSKFLATSRGRILVEKVDGDTGNTFFFVPGLANGYSIIGSLDLRGSGVKTFAYDTFYGKKITSITSLGDVEVIPDNAFTSTGGNYLISIHLTGVKVIGENAFKNCPELNDTDGKWDWVDIGTTVEYIKKDALYGVSKTGNGHDAYIKIPASLKMLDYGALESGYKVISFRDTVNGKNNWYKLNLAQNATVTIGETEYSASELFGKIWDGVLTVAQLQNAGYLETVEPDNVITAMKSGDALIRITE